MMSFFNCSRSTNWIDKLALNLLNRLLTESLTQRINDELIDDL